MAQFALFDIDGTLFLSDDPLAQHAMTEALSLMTGADVEQSAFDALDHSARTARWMAREVIRRHGLPEIDLPEWAGLVEEIYFERLPDDTDWRAPPRTAEALERLRADGVGLALVTGVPKRIALERVRRLGLAPCFGERGAFGSEVEERDDLFRLALARLGVTPSQVVHVGDTSRDVNCCKKLGIDVIATAFDGSYAHDVDGADGAVRTMPELVAAIRQLRSSRDSG